MHKRFFSKPLIFTFEMEVLRNGEKKDKRAFGWNDYRHS